MRRPWCTSSARGGRQTIRHETHTLGLFGRSIWKEIFSGQELRVRERAMDHLYDPYLPEGGEYRLTVWLGTRGQDAGTDPGRKAERKGGGR